MLYYITIRKYLLKNFTCTSQINHDLRKIIESLLSEILSDYSIQFHQLVFS